MYTIPTLVELLKTGAHFGHQVSKWHPKMEPYLFGKRNGIHIINLEKTVIKLKEALDAVRDLSAKGGVIMFLGTKRQAQEIVEKYAKECQMPYITNRWLGGTFTNFTEINKIIRKLNDNRSKREKGEFDKYTKKEQLELDREIADMEKKVGGIATLTKLPDAMYIVDIKHEKTAVIEATLKKVPIFAMVDSNVNPEKVAYGIPSNDDAVKTIELMSRLFAEAINEGRKDFEKNQAVKKKEDEAKVRAEAVSDSETSSSEKGRIITILI